VSGSANHRKVADATLAPEGLADLKERMAVIRMRVIELLALEPRDVARLILAEAVDDLNHTVRCLEGVDLHEQPQFVRIADRLLRGAEWRLTLAEEVNHARAKAR
jgi:hypothetical protein